MGLNYADGPQVLFGPLSGMEIVREGSLNGTIRHLHFRPTVNQVRGRHASVPATSQVLGRSADARGRSAPQHAVLIEELVERRKAMHGQMLENLSHELGDLPPVLEVSTLTRTSPSETQ
jgi:hypothetical protein